jgi:predicted TIM-barrel fold metal-dependent hydrolase
MSLIADAVIHAYNFAPSNFAHERYSRRFAQGTYSHHKLWSPDDPRYVLSESQFLVDFDEEDVAAAVFGESPIDVAAYHATPIFDFFKDGLVSMEKGARLKERYPRRVIFYGAVPLVDRKEAMAILEEQVKTYRVDGIKFYPALYVDGRTIPTPIDSEDIALPVIERAAELGITNFAVHKSIPLGPTTTDPYRMDDVVVPAAKFPDLKFQIVHAGIAFTEETAMLLHRFRNVYANLEGTSGYILRKPRVFYEAIGMMAEWGSYEQIIWASGCNLSHPRPLIEHFLEGSMPEDLVTGRGCPPLDARAKSLILGGNLLRLHGWPQSFEPGFDDPFVEMRKENPEPWSRVRPREAALS